MTLFQRNRLWAHATPAARRMLAAIAALGLCLSLTTAGTAQTATRNRPKDPKKDVSQIGNRGVGVGTFNMYSLEREQQLGLKFAREIEGMETIVDDPVVAEYVNRLTQNIARNSDSRLPVTAKVILSEQVNAMALVGGHIYLNSGLIELAKDESELAGVIGHEVAHIAARHSTRQITRAQTAQAAVAVLGAIFDSSSDKAATVYAIASIGLPMTFLKFSRDFERQADLLGIQYLYAAGYDPTGMVQFFERLAALQRSRGNAISKLFQSHPMPRSRVKRAQKAIGEILPDRPIYNVTGSEFENVKERLRSIAASRRAR